LVDVDHEINPGFLVWKITNQAMTEDEAKATNLFAEVGNSIPWLIQTTTKLVTVLPEDVKWENESVSCFDFLTPVGAILEISVKCMSQLMLLS
jgi:hypothetical protein